VVTRVGALTTRLRLSISHSLSAPSASVRFLKGPRQAHQQAPYQPTRSRPYLA